MAPRMQDLQVEEAHIILMNQNYKLIKSVCISHGGITETAVDIRIIMKEAVTNNATILAFCHNHPSGNICPSRYDDELTKAIKRACEVMRIHFSDHVIVTDGAYYSYHEQGKI
jgi:DNA repair protein RadC